MFRFVFLADMQLGAYASFSGLTPDQVARYAEDKGMRVESVPRVRGFDWDAGRYREAVAVINGMGPDLVVVGGDMLDDPNSEDQYDEFMRITARIDPAIPVRWVPGNHDIAPDTVAPTPDSISRYREAFGPDYFAFDHGEVRFVCLDTVVIDHPEHVPGEWDEQRAFLVEQLADAERHARRVVMIGHHPLFTSRADEPDDYWNLPMERRCVILDLIRRHRVPLALAGHWHRNSVARHGDFEMVTSGPVGYPLGDDPSGLRVVEIAEGGIRHAYRPLIP